jgi:hypothetical protein
MSNLGVLTQGAMHAVELFAQRGYEVVVFHAVGSGGRAMEELMKQGVIGAVFDYAMGEIADEVHEGLRAGGPERLTVAGELGLPQVLCPGGAEHLGVLVQPARERLVRIPLSAVDDGPPRHLEVPPVPIGFLRGEATQQVPDALVER